MSRQAQRQRSQVLTGFAAVLIGITDMSQT